MQPARPVPRPDRRGQATLQGHGPSGADAFVGGKADAQGLNGVLHVAGQIQVLGNRAQDIGLFGIAKRLMAGFVRCVDPGAEQGAPAA